MKIPGDLDILVTAETSSAQVVLEGDLDAHTAVKLRTALDKLLEEGAEHVAVDMSELEFLDSGGLRVLLDADLALRDRGGELSLVRPSGHVRRVLDMTDLADHFRLHDA